MTAHPKSFTVRQGDGTQVADSIALPATIGTAGDVLRLVDGYSLMEPTESVFEMHHAKVAIEKAEQERLATLSSLPQLTDMCAMAATVDGVDRVDVDRDDTVPVLMLTIRAGFDPVNTLLQVGRALRETFGPATWYRLHAW